MLLLFKVWITPWEMELTYTCHWIPFLSALLQAIFDKIVSLQEFRLVICLFHPNKVLWQKVCFCFWFWVQFFFFFWLVLILFTNEVEMEASLFFFHNWWFWWQKEISIRQVGCNPIFPSCSNIRQYQAEKWLKYNSTLNQFG